MAIRDLRSLIVAVERMFALSPKRALPTGPSRLPRGYSSLPYTGFIVVRCDTMKRAFGKAFDLMRNPFCRALRRLRVDGG